MTTYSADAAMTPEGAAGVNLRGKALIALGALFAYLGVATVIVEQQRAQLAGALEEIERVHREEDTLGRVNVSLAQAIIATNEAYYRADGSRRLDDVLLAAETVHTGIAGLAAGAPHLTPVNAQIAAAGAKLDAAREREDLLGLRSALHGAVGAMDRATAAARSRRQSLNDLYRTRYDQVSMTWIGFAILGMAVFGALLLRFLARLGWDLKRLQERALAVAKGYRGAALPVTRNDEIGALTRSVNRMQQELGEQEARAEMARQQQFHREKMAAIGGLAAQVAHEINNPIAAIAGLAEALPEVEGARLIVEQARRVAAITRQIAEFSSPQPAEAELVDLNAVVENTCSFARYDARLRTLELELDLDRQVPAVHGVGDHLTQVLVNLLMNAADAIADAGIPGRIRVTTRGADSSVLLTVRDNGAGMDAATRSRAFDEFFTTKTKGRGCGIGLSLSRRLLREAGADIELDSQPGRGTVVTVRVPSAPQFAH